MQFMVAKSYNYSSLQSLQYGMNLLPKQTFTQHKLTYENIQNWAVGLSADGDNRIWH